MSLTTCLRKAGDALDAADKEAILARSRELRSEGMGADAAARQAVSERLSEVDAETKASETAEREAGPAQGESSIDRMAAESPDMMVTLPGEEAPMRLADALEKVRAQAQEMREDGDLFRAAAECALMSGA